jgi:hypothetical protein
METHLINASAQHLPRPRDLNSCEAIDEYLNTLFQSLGEIIAKTVPTSKPHQNGKAWWSEKVQIAVTRLKNASRDWKNDPYNPAREIEWTSARDERNAVIRYAKRKLFRQELHEASSDPRGVWKLAK